MYNKNLLLYLDDTMSIDDAIDEHLYQPLNPDDSAENSEEEGKSK